MLCFEKFFGHRSKTAHCAVFSLRSNSRLGATQKKDSTLLGAIFFVAEREGFEPSERY